MKTKPHKWHYTGRSWNSLRDCCKELHLPLKEVSSYIREHPNVENPLASYIKENRFIVHGLIFNSLSEVALHYCVIEEDLRAYMRKGFGIDLAAYMLTRHLPINYFEVKSDEQKHY